MNFTKVTGSTPTSGEEYSLEDEKVLLDEMRDDELQRLVPTIVFLATISVVGFIGNGIVCHVYRTKYRLSNSQCFILCLGAIDLFTCCIAVPFEIVAILDQYTFSELWLCKSSRFFNTIGTMASSCLLLVIAIDRFRKVCRPFGWQITSRVAKILCALSVVFGLVLAMPAVVIYGKQTYEIEGMTLNGTECSTDDSMVGTMFPFVNAAIFATLFLTGMVTICILYCFIGSEVKRHANTMPGQYSNMRNASVPMVSSTIEEKQNSRISGELVNEVKAKRESKRESRRKSKLRMSKMRPSESGLSWSANEDLSYTMDGSLGNALEPRRSEMELVNADNHDINTHEENNTDSDDSGIKSDQVVHEIVDLEQIESSDPVDTRVQTNDEKEHRDSVNEQCKDVSNEISDHETDNVEHEKKADDDNVPIETNDTKVEPARSPSLGNSPSTSDDQMVNGKQYAKKERSLSRLSTIGSRITLAIRRMTSVSSVVSSMTMRKTQYLKQARARKTAFLMFMISLAFVLSYLPHLLLMFIRQLKDDFVDDLSESNKAVYKFFLRSYFLNSAINPIIYGVCDTRFRKACRELFSCCNNNQSE